MESLGIIARNKKTCGTRKNGKTNSTRKISKITEYEEIKELAFGTAT